MFMPRRLPRLHIPRLTGLSTCLLLRADAASDVTRLRHYFTLTTSADYDIYMLFIASDHD